MCVRESCAVDRGSWIVDREERKYNRQGREETRSNRAGCGRAGQGAAGQGKRTLMTTTA